MSTDSPIGDLVRLDDDERLDIPDARRLQVFVYEAIADALGGLLGECSGVFGSPDFGTTVGAVTIGECMLVGSKRRTGSSHRVRGGIFHYDPTSAYQVGFTTVNLSAYQSPEAFPYLWFTRAEVESDTANRKRYVGAAEVTYAPKTTKRTQIQFGVTTSRTTPPTPDADWFVFAQVTAWSGVNPNKVPTIEPIHPFDVGIVPYSEPAATPYVGSGLRQAITSAGYRLGLAHVINFLAQRVVDTQDGDWAFNPSAETITSNGTVGIVGDADPGIEQLATDVDTLIAEPRLLVWGYVTTSAAVSSFANIGRRQTAVTADSRTSTGLWVIGVKADAVKSVMVTPRNGGVDVANPHSARAQVVSVSTDEWYISVRVMDDANSLVDGDFFIEVKGDIAT